MSGAPLIRALQNKYKEMLKAQAAGISFEPFEVRGVGRLPDTTAELHQMVSFFQSHEKSAIKPGWRIEWGSRSSRRVGMQQWPDRIVVETPEDLASLTSNGHAYTKFSHWLSILVAWRSEVRIYLSDHPLSILKYVDSWPDLMSVMDVCIEQDLEGKPIRTIETSRDTKFIEQHKSILLGMLKSIDPVRFPGDMNDLESALSLSRNPFFFPIRWLDHDLCARQMHGLNLLALPVEGLRQVTWEVKEVWMVENATNLYLLPERPGAIAVFGAGKASASLKDVELFRRARLFYWGDLDDDGFKMLSTFRSLYPHAESFCMGTETVRTHMSSKVEQTQRYGTAVPSGLTQDETEAFLMLQPINGRIEQERIRPDHLRSMMERC
jgi:hypothetical protein